MRSDERPGSNLMDDLSDPRPLRAALSACGGMATVTLEAARRSPDLEIVALQDPLAEARDRAGEAFGIDRRHASFEELLTDDVDAVIVNGPNHVHRRQVELAAAAGKACLVQKPMAPTVEDAEAMVAACERHGVKLGVTMLALGDPIHHQVRAMVADGWLGEPTLVQAVGAHGIYLREPPPPGDWRRDPEKVGGGAFIQLAVHDVDLAAWILGREVTAVAAVGAGGRTVFEDETTAAAVRFGEELAGTFSASYATDLYSFGIAGTRGRIQLLPEHVVVRGEAPFRGDVFTYDGPGREVALPGARYKARSSGGGTSWRSTAPSPGGSWAPPTTTRARGSGGSGTSGSWTRSIGRGGRGGGWRSVLRDEMTS
jgi:predicted dehydrogenase